MTLSALRLFGRWFQKRGETIQGVWAWQASFLALAWPKPPQARGRRDSVWAVPPLSIKCEHAQTGLSPDRLRDCAQLLGVQFRGEWFRRRTRDRVSVHLLDFSAGAGHLVQAVAVSA